MTFSWEDLGSNTHTTIANAITNLRFRVNEDIEDLVTDAQITSMMSDALRALSVDAKVNFGVCSDTVVSGSPEYTLPTDIGDIYDVNLVNGSTVINLLATNEDEGYDSYNSYWYYRKGNKIIISSYITSGTIRIYAQKKPETPATYIDLPEEYMEAFYSYLEFSYWKRAREIEEVTIAKGLYDGHVMQILEDRNKFLPTGSYAYGEKS